MGNFRGRKRFGFGTKREFRGENFRGLFRYVQLLCGCGHKILRRKLSRMVLTRRETRKFFPSKVLRYTVCILKLNIFALFLNLSQCVFRWGNCPHSFPHCADQSWCLFCTLAVQWRSWRFGRWVKCLTTHSLMLQVHIHTCTHVHTHTHTHTHNVLWYVKPCSPALHKRYVNLFLYGAQNLSYHRVGRLYK